jgi:cytochrome c-type biogenesis protein CcsB
MPSAELVGYSNLALYSAMAVFTVSMLLFAAYLAALGPVAAERGTKRRSRQLVASRSGAAGASSPTDAPPPTDAPLPGAPSPDALSEPPSPRAARTGNIALSLAWLGTLLLIASVAMRGLAVMRPPWGNMFEFATTGSLAVSLAFCVLSLRRDVRWLGLFVVGPVLLTLGLAITVFYTEASQLMPSLKSVWLVIHVSVAILSVALFTIAFSVTILYLVKSRLEAAPGPLSRVQAGLQSALPSARALDRTAYGLHVVAFPMWTFTLIAGAIWAEQAWGHYWNWDPKEVWTFIIWVVYAAYLHARATTGWSARSASFIALAGYGCILVNYMVVNVYFVGQHSYSGM